MATKTATKKRGRPSKAEIERKTTARKAEIKRSQQRNALLFFILGLVFTVLAFVKGTSIWDVLHTALFGVFGVLAYIVGPVMLYLAILFALGKSLPGPQIIKAAFLILTISSALLIFGKLPLINATTGEEIEHNGSFISYLVVLFEKGMTKSGGGALASLLGWPLLQCGIPAARAMSIILLLIAAMLVSGKTVLDIINALKASSTKVKELSEKQRAEREMQKELQRELEQEQTVSDNTTSVIPVENKTVGVSAVPAPSIDIPLESEKRKKPVKTTNSRIDISLGPDTSPSEPIELDLIPEKLSKKGTGPAADVVQQVFDHDREINEKFANFGENTPSLDELINRETAGVKHDQSTINRETKKNNSTESLFKTASSKTENDNKTGFIGEYKFPSVALLDKDETNKSDAQASAELRANAKTLVDTLDSFGVKTKIVDISRGPTVTRYELQPEVGVRLNRIVNLSDDLALNLAALGVRIEAPIPGKAAVGVEIPNKVVRTVRLRTVLESESFVDSKSPITTAIGVDLNGENRVWDIGRMPHLLIAGSTGMGKSVFINSMIISLVYKSSPEDLKMILIDPKMVEFTVYRGLPHLPVPVVTEPTKAAGALGAALSEMLRRYKLFADKGVRNIEEYNTKIEKERLSGETSEEEQETQEKKARWIVIIDELADLMMTSPREVENSITRIAQMGRAAGIHLVVATQRPSVDVITGTIKNNIPTRVAFRVSSQVDSRTILDSGGAEKLVGRGDMLFQPVGQPKPIRIQGCFVSDDEVQKVVDEIKKNAVAQYNEDLLREIEENAVSEKGKDSNNNSSDDSDVMLDNAIEVVVEAGAASTSLLQRRLKLGYARAARIMDEMESMGIIGPADGSKPRTVSISRQQWQERLLNKED